MDSIHFSLGEIGQVEVKVRDVDSAVKFYEEKLGIRLLYSDAKSAVCDCNGIRLMLSKSDTDISRSVIYFKVDDIHSAYTFLDDRGVKFLDVPKKVVNVPDYTLWLAFFHDMDDNLLALMSEQTVSASWAVTNLDLMP
jgi:catechol 2,3-dioxygenase-like lactoylglutathione lyase family enzyme